jgi:hypothetical protein
LIKEEQLWLGYHNNKTLEFRLHTDYERWDREDVNGNKYGKVPAICWFTNLSTTKRQEPLILYRKYTPEDYPKYDNYDAINVDKVVDIPTDYFGVMGVPITFLDKYCPEQFTLLGIMNTGEENQGIRYKDSLHGRPIVNGVELYLRILIQRK